MLSVLVPIGCGVMGAILIVCVAYGLRNCNTDNSSQTTSLAAIKRRTHQTHVLRVSKQLLYCSGTFFCSFGKEVLWGGS